MLAVALPKRAAEQFACSASHFGQVEGGHDLGSCS